MSTRMLAESWKDIAAQFLKIGATAYGGPAIMGIMQSELQEKRRWISKERFVEGLSLVNMLPGATAAQLSIFLGYACGGWWGGLLGGLCFVLPGFVVLLALTIGYATLGVSPILRGALYGLGPVVLGVYLVAVYRLARVALSTRSQVAIAIAAAAATLAGPVGVAAILLVAGGVGLWLFHSTRLGVTVLVALGACLAVAQLVTTMAPSSPAAAAGSVSAPTVALLGTFLLKVGALTFGGGLTMIAFIQEQVVDQFGWLTPQEFVDGLALGQFTPGPILMVAAYVGYKAAGAVSLVRLAPHALPDVLAGATLIATVVVLMVWRVATLKVMLVGAVLGVVRSRLVSLPGARAVLSAVMRA